MRRSALFNSVGGCCVVAFVLMLNLLSCSVAQESSASNADISRKDLGGQTELLENCQRENAKLRDQIDSRQDCLNAWGDNAAEANAEAEVFRRQYEFLMLRMEALGLTTVGEGKDLVEQRLLKSVRDTDLLREQRDKLNNQLLALAEVTLRYMSLPSASDNPQTRRELETELQATNETLGVSNKSGVKTEAVPAGFQTGLVLSYKEELSLLVANFGRLEGVKVGMPLSIMRGDLYIAKARIVQVRERISGGNIELPESKGNKTRIGDQLRIDALN